MLLVVRGAGATAPSRARANFQQKIMGEDKKKSMTIEITKTGDIITKEKTGETSTSEENFSNEPEKIEKKTTEQKIIDRYTALSREVKRLKEKYTSIKKRLEDEFGFKGGAKMSSVAPEKRALAEALLKEHVEGIEKLLHTQRQMLKMQKDASSAILKVKLIEIDKVVS